MKRTIQGIRYDASNAVFCGYAEDKEWTAMLYRTPRSNRYFLLGSGSMMSVFRGKTKIIPISDDAAKLFTQNYIKKEV